MNLLVLYVIMLKVTLSTFSGLAGLPIIRDELVVKRHVLTDRQLNATLVVGRTTPGPKGLYLIGVGYYAAGFPGATIAWLALLTPALLVGPVLHWAGRYATHPLARQVLTAVVLASAGISLSATLPLAVDALAGWLSYLLAMASLIVLLLTKLDTLWVILGAAAVSAAAALLHA